jgi:hypothetical protein
LIPPELRENEQSITRDSFRVKRPNFAAGIPETAEVQRESYTRTGVMGYEASGLMLGGLFGPPEVPALAREAINPAAVAPTATPAAILKTFRRVVPSVSISLMISLLSMFVSPLKVGMKPFVSTRYQILIERNSQTVSPSARFRRVKLN